MYCQNTSTTSWSQYILTNPKLLQILTDSTVQENPVQAASEFSKISVENQSTYLNDKLKQKRFYLKQESQLVILLQDNAYLVANISANHHKLGWEIIF